MWHGGISIRGNVWHEYGKCGYATEWINVFEGGLRLIKYVLDFESPGIPIALSRYSKYILQMKVSQYTWMEIKWKRIYTSQVPNLQIETKLKTN